MTLFVRKWTCGICGHPVMYDTETGTINCKCKPTFIGKMDRRAKRNFILLKRLQDFLANPTATKIRISLQDLQTFEHYFKRGQR